MSVLADDKLYCNFSLIKFCNVPQLSFVCLSVVVCVSNLCIVCFLYNNFYYFCVNKIIVTIHTQENILTFNIKSMDVF